MGSGCSRSTDTVDPERVPFAGASTRGPIGPHRPPPGSMAIQPAGGRSQHHQQPSSSSIAGSTKHTRDASNASEAIVGSAAAASNITASAKRPQIHIRSGSPPTSTTPATSNPHQQQQFTSSVLPSSKTATPPTGASRRAQTLAAAAKAAGLGTEEDDDGHHQQHADEETKSGETSGAKPGETRTSPLNSLHKAKRKSSIGLVGSGNSIITTTNATAATSSNGASTSVAPKGAIASMLADSTVRIAPAATSKRGSIKTNITITSKAVSSSTSPTPSIPPTPSKKPTITLAAKSPAPSPTSSAQPKIKLTTNAEKAELQQLLLDMQKKTDTWISNLEAKQSPEQIQAELAMIQTTKETLEAQRSAANNERAAQIEKKMAALVDTRYDAFTQAVESDKMVTNLRIDMERKKKKMAEEEAQRTEKRKGASTQISVDLTPSPSPTSTGSDSTSEVSKVSPSQSAVSATAIHLTPAHRAIGSVSVASTTRRDASVDYAGTTTTEEQQQHAALPQVTTPTHGSLKLHPSLSTNSSSSSSSSAAANHSRNTTNTNLDETAALRKATAELNALKRSNSSAEIPPLTNSPHGATGLPQQVKIMKSSPSASSILLQGTGIASVAGVGLSPTHASRKHVVGSSISELSLAAVPSPSTPTNASTIAAPAASTVIIMPSTSTPPVARRNDVGQLTDELRHGTSHDAEARGKTLEQRAAGCTEGHQKQVLQSQARICYQMAEVLKLEEQAAKKKEALYKEQEEMKQFIQYAQTTKDTIVEKNTQRRKTKELEFSVVKTTTPPQPMPITSS